MILAILQARVSSTRLPGKVLKPILGKPMLAHQINRVLRSKYIDKIIVATSSQNDDDAIFDLCQDMGIDCYRGSLDDVLDRFYKAANLYMPDHIVRLTGDCPLTDPNIIDKVISEHLNGSFDYTSNVLEPTYPDGLDVEVFHFDCLELAWKKASSKAQREHVTLFMYDRPGLLKLGSVKHSTNLANLRWTVDEILDFEFVTKIYEQLYPANPNFSTDDILQLLKAKPQIQDINSMFKRNEGLKKSLKNDLSIDEYKER